MKMHWLKMTSFRSGRWADLLKDTIGRPFHSPFAQNSHKWKSVENACTGELLKLWHITAEEQTLEMPSAQHALLAICHPSTAPSCWGVEDSLPGLPGVMSNHWALMLSLHPWTCEQAHRTHSRSPTLEWCGTQLTRERAKRGSKEGCCGNTNQQWGTVHLPEEFYISHCITLTNLWIRTKTRL